MKQKQIKETRACHPLSYVQRRARDQLAADSVRPELPPPYALVSPVARMQRCVATRAYGWTKKTIIGVPTQKSCIGDGSFSTPPACRVWRWGPFFHR